MEKDNSSRDGHFAAAVPVEKAINSDGSVSVLYKVAADCEQSAEILRQLIGEETGSLPKVIGNNSSESSFFFSSSRWNVSYEPTGPGKNWATPPEDPSRN